MAETPLRYPWLALGLTVLFWASSFPGIEVALTGYDPVAMTTLRYAVSSVLLLPVAVVRRLRRPGWRDGARMLLLGLLGIVVYHLLVSYGQQTVSAGAAGVLSNTSPIFTALLGALFFAERLRPAGWAGIALAFFGASLIGMADGGSLKIDTGAVLVLLAALTWAVYFAAQKALLGRYGALELMTWVIWAGALLMLPFAPTTVATMRAAGLDSTLAVIYLGTFPTVVAYVAWAHVLSRMPLSLAGSALYAVPVLAFLLAWLLLGETPSALTAVGGAVALAGVATVNLYGRPRVKAGGPR